MTRQFAMDALVYAFPMLLAKAIGLILLPIYARQLGPADFGFIEIIAAVSVILLLVLPFEINQAVARLMPESNDLTRHRKIISSALWFTCIMFCIFANVVYLLDLQILAAVNLSGSYSKYTVMVCLNLLITAVLNFLQILFRFSDQAKASVSINLSVIFANFGFVLYFSTVDRLGVEQFFLSQVMSGLIGVLLGFSVLIRKYGRLNLGIDLPVMRELFAFSAPIVLSSIGVGLSGSIDRLMVGGYAGLADLGHYGVAARLAAIIGLGFSVISTAMTPLVYRRHEQAETKKLIAGICQFAIYACVVLLSLIAIYSETIIMLIAGDKFSKASDYVFYLMLSAAITNMHIFFLGMDIKKNTWLLSKINLSTGLLGSVGCVVLVPLIGIWGAIASILLANLARLFAYIYFSQRSYHVPVHLGWPFLMLVALVIACSLNIGMR